MTLKIPADKPESQGPTCKKCIHKRMCEPNHAVVKFFWSTGIARYLRPGVHTDEMENFLAERCICFQGAGIPEETPKTSTLRPLGGPERGKNL